jgi:hypothetical protein
LIGNGQPLDAIRLACAFNLTDKCPLSVMYDYVDKAKKAAEEILSKERDSPESLVCFVSWETMSFYDDSTYINMNTSGHYISNL